MRASEVVTGLICCAYMTPESCRACPYGDDVPDGCYQLRRDAGELRERLEREEEDTG